MGYKNNLLTVTTFIVPKILLSELKAMCLLTNCRQSEFIRISIREKIKRLKEEYNNRAK